MNTNVLERQDCVLGQPLGLKIQRKQNSSFVEMRPSLARGGGGGEYGVGRNATLGAKVVHATSPANVVPQFGGTVILIKS